MKRIKTGVFLFLLTGLVMIPAGSVYSAVTSNDLLQFSSGDHILGFKNTGIVTATGSHALQVSFDGTKGVRPMSAAGIPEKSDQISSLKEVRYPDLWDGITLTYRAAPGDIFESVYTVKPHADVGTIRLIYNVPVQKAENGCLKLVFKNGYMTESAPVAWQEIDGKNVTVMISFRTIGTHGVGFEAGPYDPAHALIIDPVLSWNTFLGSPVQDTVGKIVEDNAGNIYVAGQSQGAWGSPRRAYSGNDDVFVAKLDSTGNLLWNTFLGSNNYDGDPDIAVNDSGKVYVTSSSSATWGSPVVGFSEVGSTNAFVARLDTNGTLEWHTFMGAASGNPGMGEATYSSGLFLSSSDNIYITGVSTGSWGTPVNAHTGGGTSYDVFVAKLDNGGNRIWHTFMGGNSIYDRASVVTADSDNNVYVGGNSNRSWGTPVNPFATNMYGEYDGDAFVAKLDNSGKRLWHTFMGSDAYDDGSSDDNVSGIITDSSGNAYVIGTSYTTWGTPINAFSVGGETSEIFMAKLDTNGVRAWNTFHGSPGSDSDTRIIHSPGGDIDIFGLSSATWGTPVNPHPGEQDAFTARLTTDGALLWNTFLGLNNTGAYAYYLTTGANGRIYAGGTTFAGNWGNPINPAIGGADVLLVCLDLMPPTVRTEAASTITGISATSGGEVTDAGASPVMARGICWSTSSGPTTDDSKTEDGSGTGTFISNLTGLTPDTTYYVRAYATSHEGTTYGEEKEFATFSHASVTTASIDSDSITDIGATGGGIIMSDGGAAITVRGICWSTSHSPTTDNDTTTDGHGTGTFTSSMTGLLPDITYYVRAYATNSAGTAYGDEVEFKTIEYPSVTTIAVSNISSVTAESGGEVTSEGSSPATARGVCWSTSSGPTTADSNTTDGSGSGSFTSTLTGLLPYTTYYVRAYVTSDEGTRYGDETEFKTLTYPAVTTAAIVAGSITDTEAESGGIIVSNGGAAVTERGICWSTSHAPTTVDSSTTDGTGTGAYTSSLTGLLPDTTYYVRAYATNSVGTVYGGEEQFTTLYYPSVTTAAVSNISDTLAVCGGEVTDEGASPVTARGVCWSTSTAPTIADKVTEDGSGSGVFSGSLTGLLPGTTYYVRAYATSTVGTSYGDEQDFKTLDYPSVTTAAVGNITETKAIYGGEVTNDGGSTITARGVCWGTLPEPTPADSITTNGAGPGVFTGSLTDLLPNTAYYVRAYAVNLIGTSYGPQHYFTTLNLTDPDRPAISYPTSGQIMPDGEVGLSMDEYTGAGTHTRTTWRIWRWDRPAPEGDICPTCIYEEVSDTDLLTHNVNGLLPGLKYGWLIGVETDAMATGHIAWSETSTFIVGETVTDISVELPANSLSLVSFPMWLQDGNAPVAADASVGFFWDMEAYDTFAGNYTDSPITEPGAGYFGNCFHETPLALSVTGVPVTLAADLEVMLDYNADTKDGWNLIGPSNNSVYFWAEVEVIAYDEAGNIVFGPQAIGELEADNPYLDPALMSWSNTEFEPFEGMLMPYTGYGVTARQARVSLLFPQNAQRTIVTSPDDDENNISGGGGGICFIESLRY